MIPIGMLFILTYSKSQAASPSEIMQARAVEEVPSQFGALQIKEDGDDCKILFKSTLHGEIPLLHVEYCSVNFGMATIGSVSGLLDTLLFPVVSGGTEYHFFEIATARGGNACSGSDYYVLALDGQRAWASESLGGCDELSKVTIREDNSIRLHFSSGIVDVRMGSATIVPAPSQVRTVLSTQTKIVRGLVSGGSHADNFMYSIATQDGEDWGYFRTGDCSIPVLGESLKLEIMIERVQYGDDSPTQETTCVGVRE